VEGIGIAELARVDEAHELEHILIQFDLRTRC
jgi:hypothetical protein